MGRSLRASKEGAIKAQEKFKLSGKTKEYLAGASGCSRPTLDKFFNRINIDKQKFIGICEALELDWEEIAEFDTGDNTKLEEIEISQLVVEIRDSVKESVEQECGTMRVLDMTRPIELNDIYTQVNILEKIIGRRGFNLDQLLQDCDLEDFERFGLGRIQQQRVPGLEAVRNNEKLMILGKPGVGKTTFLKYLAIQCNRGKFATTRIPIFIPLKKFAETPGQLDLQAYIFQWFNDSKVNNVTEKIAKILSAGRGLILLDGLDEVREEDSQRVIRKIESFYKSFSENQFAITCRIAAREYTFEHFTEVEVADFDEQQIEDFVNSWFTIKKLENYPKYFIEQLEANPTIKELANNPLLLTLLCLEFEDSGSFPSDRADLYARATNTLLRKWDDKRHIYREQVYKELNPKRKEGLLSQIAFQTFDKKEYFFRQRTIERYIGEYICNLANAPITQDALDVDSQAVLKSIEAQHGLLVERARGIYSFSHLTFQEYFTARKVATISNPNILESALVNLASHVTEKRWREVFLLTTGILEPADRLLQLMKQEIDLLVVNEPKLQKLLSWATVKANSVHAPYKIAAIRAFYLLLFLSISLDLDLSQALSESLFEAFNLSLDLYRSLELSLDLYRSLELDLDLSQALELSLSRFLSLSISLDLSRSLDLSLSQALEQCQNQELKLILEKLQKQLPNPKADREEWKQWWKNNFQVWTDQLRKAMIEHRNIGHNWQFNQKQVDLLNQYLTANKLLVDCLNSECYVSREVREEIENTLLLPKEV